MVPRLGWEHAPRAFLPMFAPKHRVSTSRPAWLHARLHGFASQKIPDGQCRSRVNRAFSPHFAHVRFPPNRIENSDPKTLRRERNSSDVGEVPTDDVARYHARCMERPGVVTARPFRVGIVQCRGTAYEVGRAQARLFAATPKGRAFLRREKTKLPWWFKLNTEERGFRKFAPALWEEIHGLADGLTVPLERAVMAFGNNGLRPPLGACSAIMAAGGYARNYDFQP